MYNRDILLNLQNDLLTFYSDNYNQSIVYIIVVTGIFSVNNFIIL